MPKTILKIIIKVLTCNLLENATRTLKNLWTGSCGRVCVLIPVVDLGVLMSMPDDSSVLASRMIIFPYSILAASTR
jgi:hypothetical protein